MKRQNSRQEWLESWQANNVFFIAVNGAVTQGLHLSLSVPLTDLQEGPHLFGDTGASEGLLQGGARRRAEQRLLPEGAQRCHLLGYQPQG